MENQTSDFSLSENLTDEVIGKFNESGVLSIKDEKIAHSILSGTIKKSPMDLIVTIKMSLSLSIDIRLMSK